MTTDKKKNYWRLNWYSSMVVAIIEVFCFAWEFFIRKAPTEPTWGEEAAKYLIMWLVLTVIVWVIFYAVFMPWAGRLAEKEKEKLK